MFGCIPRYRPSPDRPRRFMCVEVVRAASALREAGLKWIAWFCLFKAAGTPAEVAFDVPYRDFSWMGYLASAGFDVFSMDMTGYGRFHSPCSHERSLQFPRTNSSSCLCLG